MLFKKYQNVAAYREEAFAIRKRPSTPEWTKAMPQTAELYLEGGC